LFRNSCGNSGKRLKVVGIEGTGQLGKLNAKELKSRHDVLTRNRLECLIVSLLDSCEGRFKKGDVLYLVTNFEDSLGVGEVVAFISSEAFNIILRHYSLPSSKIKITNERTRLIDSL
jgi:hypothetical protein